MLCGVVGVEEFLRRDQQRLLALLVVFEVDAPADGIREDFSNFEININARFKNSLEVTRGIELFEAAHVLFLDHVLVVFDFDYYEGILLVGILIRY